MKSQKLSNLIYDHWVKSYILTVKTNKICIVIFHLKKQNKEYTSWLLVKSLNKKKHFDQPPIFEFILVSRKISIVSYIYKNQPHEFLAIQKSFPSRVP